MSNFLAVDTSSRYLTVIAARGGRAVKRYIADCALLHSVTLMGEVESALYECGLTPGECDFFAAVTGPGSFTGIRIGISTAKGLALATGKPLVSVTSFDLIAYNVNTDNFYVVIDAAHGHGYVKGFGQAATEPKYLPFESIAALGYPLYGFEELPFKNYTRLNAGECLMPAVLALEGSACGEMSALYVRKSQAEEGRK